MSDGGSPTGKWVTPPPHILGTGRPTSLKEARARLIVKRPNVPEVEIQVEKQDFTIGRSVSESDLVLDDEWVSRNHVSLSMNERGYFELRDLGSRNGIEYEGRYVRRLNLLDGDEFKIGRTEFVFRANLPPGQPPTYAKVVGPNLAPDSVMIEVQIPPPRPDPALHTKDEEIDAWTPEKAAERSGPPMPSRSSGEDLPSAENASGEGKPVNPAPSAEAGVALGPPPTSKT